MSGNGRRIGILTSGGDCPGLNAVLRSVVKTASRHGYEVVGFLRGFEGLVDPVSFRTLDYQNTEHILNQGGTILGSTNRGRFAAKTGVENRQAIDPALLDEAVRTCHQLQLEGLICVGGDGSLSIAQQLFQHGAPVVGVPKTIDNDLSATLFTFGFDSAVDCVTDALDRLHTTAASHDRVMVLEVMGRHAGWIALYAGISGGGDVILIPEIEWSFDNVCRAITERERRGKKFTLVVVAEGAQLPNGQLVAQDRGGADRQVRLGGLGAVVAEEIQQRLSRETRAVVLGHLQRGGAPSAFDRVLATTFGAHAVRLVIEGRFGEMVCYDPPQFTSCSIQQAVEKLRTVDPNDSTVLAARAMGISFGDDATWEATFRAPSSSSRQSAF